MPSTPVVPQLEVEALGSPGVVPQLGVCGCEVLGVLPGVFQLGGAAFCADEVAGASPLEPGPQGPLRLSLDWLGVDGPQFGVAVGPT